MSPLSAMMRRLLVVAAVLGTIGCDRITKHAASSALADMPMRSYLADTVRLGYAENTGGFLGLGSSLPPGARSALFTAATGAILLVLTVFALRQPWDTWQALGVALFIAGGVSNWIDRLLRGSVVDFLNVGIGPLRTGIFNVADVAIMTGAAVLVVREIQKLREPAAMDRSGAHTSAE